METVMTRGADAVNAMPSGMRSLATGLSSGTASAARMTRKSGLRRWQQEAARTWEEAGRPSDFLAEATPGAGKTTFALHLAHRALSERHVQTVAVVCPTAHLRRQWQIAPPRSSIELCTEIAGPWLDAPFRGAALTYQQVLA